MLIPVRVRALDWVTLVWDDLMALLGTALCLEGISFPSRLVFTTLS